MSVADELNRLYSDDYVLFSPLKWREFFSGANAGQRRVHDSGEEIGPCPTCGAGTAQGCGDAPGGGQ